MTVTGMRIVATQMVRLLVAAKKDSREMVDSAQV